MWLQSCSCESFQERPLAIVPLNHPLTVVTSLVPKLSPSHVHKRLAVFFDVCFSLIPTSSACAWDKPSLGMQRGCGLEFGPKHTTPSVSFFLFSFFLFFFSPFPSFLSTVLLWTLLLHLVQHSHEYMHICCFNSVCISAVSTLYAYLLFEVVSLSVFRYFTRSSPAGCPAYNLSMTASSPSWSTVSYMYI